MRKFGKLFAAVGLTALLVLSSAAAVFAEEGASTFVPGTTINSISVGGMTVDAAKSRIEAFYSAEYKLTIHERNGKTEIIKGSDIGYQASIAQALQTILEAQNQSGRAYGPETDNSHRLEVSVSYSQEALAAKIQTLNCITGAGITKTADAYISSYQEGKAFTIIPEVNGNSVVAEKAAAVIAQAVASGAAEVDLEASGCYETVNVTSEDSALQALCNALNACREITVTYRFGDASEVLSGEQLCSWVSGTANGQIQLNQDLAGAWLNAMASKYNTAGTERVFRTINGAEVPLTGPYGWKMDVGGELQALQTAMLSGQSADREPAYVLRAASRTAPDWGNTYVEIDLTNQHVYMIQEGMLVWEAPCVTGNVAKNYTTPAGIYSLTYKERDRVLRGEKRADGTYEYESPVDYWMPFNGGIGLHDANWRSNFGGTIYQTSGSHGCVNLPPAKVPALYDLVYKGIPVICYN